MNLSDEQRDAMLIDRLVDGELSGNERRDLLASLEAQPDGWRRCALAFIEVQTWREAMGSVLRERKAPADAGNTMDVAQDASATISPAPNETSRSQLGTWFAVAASVVVAFGLGRQSGSTRSTSEPANQQLASAPTTISQKKIDAQQSENAGRGDAITLVVNDRDGVSRRIEVPLVEGQQLGRAFGNVPNWTSPELDRQLDERGLDLDARRRYAPLYFEQENKIVPMVVPVDDAVVRPANRPVY
ncbi:hypothetical protein [Lacipirellula limnantheis]|nr:hypothetical protein [Lacipirellula limnantheis]